MASVISFLEMVKRDMEDNIYNFTKDGKCSSCGGCCSNLLPMSDKEISIIKKYIEKHHIKECKHIIPTKELTFDMTCPFRDNDNKICTVYEVRPQICKSFLCDSEKRAKQNRKLIGQTRTPIDVRGTFYGS